MKVIQASYEILSDLTDTISLLRDIERAGRVCYKSENRITDDSCRQFCKTLIEHGHEAMIEHAHLSVKFTIDRGLSHEIVRHRLFSFAQSSTRYCNYSKGKFGNEISVIKPDEFELNTDSFNIWYNLCKHAETAYMDLLNIGVRPELARNVLPISLATELVVTGNIREWRHFFNLRCDKAAHPQMRAIVIKLLNELKQKIPILFDDII